MYIKVIHDDGRTFEYDGVLTYDFIDKDDVRSVAEGLNVDLTDAQVQEVGRRLDKYEEYPDSACIHNEIKNVLKGVKNDL